MSGMHVNLKHNARIVRLGGGLSVTDDSYSNGFLKLVPCIMRSLARDFAFEVIIIHVPKVPKSITYLQHRCCQT